MLEELVLYLLVFLQVLPEIKVFLDLSFSLVRSLLQSSRTLEVIHSALYCSWSLVYPGSEVFFGVLGARDVVNN